MRKREEALAAHISPWPTKHSGNRHAKFHDYSSPGYYLITLVCMGRRPMLGSLEHKAPASPEVILSPLGLRIASEEAKVISMVYPMVNVRYFKVMPDHLHIILQIKEPMPEGKDLGKVVKGFKSGCRRAFGELYGEKDNIFEKGYNDRILFDYRQLQAWYRYLDENPIRLAIKRAIPELFKVRRKIPVNGRECDAVGNLFLLDIPQKQVVIVHGDDTDVEFAEKMEDWLKFGEAGGVLVSAAISKREKIVMREAINRGYPMIIVRNEGMNRFYKPGGEAFEACARGQLLQISPFPENFSQRRITRPECLWLNGFATGIAAEQPASMSSLLCR